MLNLEEMQFELLPSLDAAEGFGFGIDLDVSVDDGGFDPGSGEWLTQDVDNTATGTTMFGRDVLTGPVWVFGLHVDREDVATALESYGRAANAWRGRGVVGTPGAIVPLRYRMGDRVRRVYGRPRRFAGPPTNRILGGYIPITADFKCIDAQTYADAASSAVLTLSAASQGGFAFPVTFPVLTLPSGGSNGSLFVGGDVPARPTIRIEGPINSPYVGTDDWTLSLDTNLGANDWVEIDARPWGMTVLKNGTQSIAGKLGRRQWLRDVALTPGEHPISFGGVSSTGGATCTITWHDTYDGI